MVMDPSGFWSAIGFGRGDDLVRGIYGGAIIGEGVIMAFGVRQPARYVMILQYLMVYKTVACIAALRVLWAMESPPMGGYLVVAGWVFAGIAAAAVYPWGQGQELFLAATHDQSERR